MANANSNPGRRNSPSDNVLFHTGPESEAAILVSTCLSELQTQTISNNIIVSYYLSFLVAVRPDLRETALGVLRSFGVNVTEITSNEEREARGIVLREPISPPLIGLYFCQCVLVLYKNIHQSTYDRFMTKRTNALKAISGALADDQVSTCLTLEKATVVRRMLGSKYQLRKDVLSSVIEASLGGSMFASMCHYVCDILSWTEMSGLSFAFDHLIFLESAVLKHPSMRDEARSLEEAYRVINNTTYPHFFKILHPPHVTHVANRSRFPTLLAVAEKLNFAIYPSNGNLVSHQPVADAAAVDNLVRLHPHDMRVRGPTNDPIIMQMLEELKESFPLV